LSIEFPYDCVNEGILGGNMSPSNRHDDNNHMETGKSKVYNSTPDVSNEQHTATGDISLFQYHPSAQIANDIDFARFHLPSCIIEGPAL
jgi:hypothetical protein